MLLRKCGKALEKPCAHLLVLAAETHGVVRVGGHAFKTEEQRGAQRHDVRLAAPEPRGVLRISVPTVRPQGVLRAHSEGADGGIVEVHIGERSEQTVGKQPRYLARMLTVLFTDLR